jgi:hypothetical protein
VGYWAVVRKKKSAAAGWTLQSNPLIFQGKLRSLGYDRLKFEGDNFRISLFLKQQKGGFSRK